MKNSESQPKRGRPPLGDEAKGAVVRARVTKELHEQLEKAAEKEGMTLSDWVRETLKEAVEKRDFY